MKRHAHYIRSTLCATCRGTKPRRIVTGLAHVYRLRRNGKQPRERRRVGRRTNKPQSVARIRGVKNLLQKTKQILVDTLEVLLMSVLWVRAIARTVADRCWATFGNGRRRLSCLFPVFKWTTRIAKTAVRGLGIEKSSKAGVGRRARPSRVRHIDTRFGRTCTTRSVDFAPLSVARKSARFAFFRKKYRAAQNVATWSRWKEFLRISRRITS
mmetsp:Transcript_7405/g.29773  ORF Transcript_7405/g.29773 Transcript_7405/m.29773 type:complete len:212 (-) Transcript_7405:325-960(-)